MFPILASLPAWLVTALFGALLGGMLASGSKRPIVGIAGTIGGALLGTIIALNKSWGHNWVPIRGYGVMILIGFLVGVWLAWRRAPQIGVESTHTLDLGMFGVVVGLAGARVFHIIMHWPDFNPFASGSFDYRPIIKMFLIWEGGLVFYGTM